MACYWKNSCFRTTHKSSVSSGFAEQIMPILRILCYNGSLVTLTVVSLTTAKFKPLIFLAANDLHCPLETFVTDPTENTYYCWRVYRSVALPWAWPLLLYALPSNGLFTRIYLRGTVFMDSFPSSWSIHHNIKLIYIYIYFAACTTVTG
jgi:hypothetical protein